MYRKWIWASAAIVAMWIAVLFASVFGPRLVVESVAGDRVDLPLTALAVAFFAFVATIVVAVVGFRGAERPAETPAGEPRAEGRPTSIPLLGGR